MVGKAIKERGRHLRIAEDRWPFAEFEVCRHDDRRSLVEPADEVEEELSAGLSEWQVAELVEDPEVEATQQVRGAPLPVGAGLSVELVPRSTTLKHWPRLPCRMQARAILTARCDLPDPVPPISTTLHC